MHNYHYRSYLFMIIVAVILVAIALCMAFVIGYTIFWYLRNWFSSTQTVRAKVYSKKTRHLDAFATLESTDLIDTPNDFMERLGNRYTRFKGKIGLSECSVTDSTDCIVVFLVDSKKLEFCVPCSTYTAVENGDEGILSFKGEQFKSFTPIHDYDTGGWTTAK